MKHPQRADNVRAFTPRLPRSPLKSVQLQPSTPTAHDPLLKDVVLNVAEIYALNRLALSGVNVLMGQLLDELRRGGAR